MRGRWPRLQHYGAAGDINGHAGMLNEEVLQGIALEAGRPKAGPLCSKTGGRGNKPALVHQGGRGWRAACRSRRGPGVGVGRSCIAVYRVWEWEAMQRRGGSRVGQAYTHTHIPGHRGWGEKGHVSQTCSSLHRAQRAPEGQDPYLARCPRGPRCMPQQMPGDRTLKRTVCVTAPLGSLLQLYFAQ